MKTLHSRLEERFMSRMRTMTDLERSLTTSLEEMRSDIRYEHQDRNERNAKMLMSIAHKKLKAVIGEAKKPCQGPRSAGPAEGRGAEAAPTGSS